MLSPTKSPPPAYMDGCLASGSFCISGRRCLIGHVYCARIVRKGYDSISSIAARYPTSDQTDPVGLHGEKILALFGPSEIPPRLASCFAQARIAIVKEIDDLLRTHAGIPPEMAQPYPNGPRYLTPPRAFPTMIVKRKSIVLYKTRFPPSGRPRPSNRRSVNQFAHIPSGMRSFVDHSSYYFFDGKCKRQTSVNPPYNQ